MNSIGKTLDVDISGPGIAAFVVSLACGLAGSKVTNSPVPLIAGLDRKSVV